jgi:hypothetical protein
MKPIGTEKQTKTKVKRRGGGRAVKNQTEKWGERQ